ncbi:exonuclease SbcCD subunit D [uncultured Ruminococcus sp.]|uniref:exonuclease SbcCD subunit D n=1 Tax=uncultured Ruminococcus sp. TaxID=165186 RepID=UPI000EC50AC2|nr:exonuclease SbcCD subunit D [uncultured Ruminococcus sp.]HCJ41606.1 exonuclease sbcCD subunit D [Ruminococcus sp.]
MKLAHISDLHLGKKLDNFSLIENQEHILAQIIDTALSEGCDGILIAGDVYDKSIPSAEAVKLFNEFLTNLSKTPLAVYIISGNHDSSERVNYASEILKAANIHIGAVYDSKPEIITVSDGYGELDICLMPFVKPSTVKGYYPDAVIDSYTDMMRVVIEKSGIDKSRRCVMVCHQFITGASTCDSEYASVGTLDNIDASVFEGFDYVALGHIHSPQNIAENVRYCGSPLKYSVSEIDQKKSVTIVELKGKNDVSVYEKQLVPLREMIPLKGSYDRLMERSFYEGLDLDDFFSITLTDEDEIPYVMNKLRNVYKYIVSLSYDNIRTRTESIINGEVSTETRSPLELFSSLFRQQWGRDMSDEQNEYINRMIEEIWEDEE